MDTLRSNSDLQNLVEETNKEIPILFKEYKDCCGCGACVNICPKQAISMQEDACGFLYPKIDEKKCIRCGKCKQVCAFQNIQVSNYPLQTYAAIGKSEEIVEKSASGGVFASLAKKFLQDGGVVYGAAFEEDFSVAHILIEDENKVQLLQGSKYTQSNTKNTYKQVREFLNKGKKVMYSGTPCQIAGLYGYLGKEYNNLLTIDLICHGVPSNKMFQEYIQLLGKKNNGKVTAFTFRDKKNGWGKNGKATIYQTKGVNKVKRIWESASTYLYYFSKGWICRESCYNCKYASSHRPADLTLGDYWGIEKVHPEYLKKNEWNEQKGISVIIVNSKKGENILKEADTIIDLKLSDFEKASDGNAQLREPSSKGKREELITEYLLGGWERLERRYNKSIGWRKYSSQIKAWIPKKIKRILKRIKR